MTALLVRLLQLYRRWVSPLTPAACRYTPSCSQYAEEALRVHGFIHGLALIVRRLARCHPWGGEGLDPVPPRPIRKEA